MMEQIIDPHFEAALTAFARALDAMQRQMQPTRWRDRAYAGLIAPA